MKSAMNELWANLYLQNHAEINGRKVFHYLIQTAIGNISIVEYEEPSKQLKRFMYGEDYEAAERKFKACCKWVMMGK